MPLLHFMHCIKVKVAPEFKGQYSEMHCNDSGNSHNFDCHYTSRHHYTIIHELVTKSLIKHKQPLSQNTVFYVVQYNTVLYK